MKGSINVTVKSKKVHFSFTLNRNITIIKGDSATGKTTLVEMIRQYSSQGVASGVQVVCEKECIAPEGSIRDLANVVEISQRIVFLDESTPYLKSDEFARLIEKSDNYFVLVTREALNNLPYSVKEIYRIHESGKYKNLQTVYNEFERIYEESRIEESVPFDVIITEDSNAGHELYQKLCENSITKCVSADGKSNVKNKIFEYVTKGERVLAIVDGAAFGADMEAAVNVMERVGSTRLWTPESFEYLLLKSGIFVQSKKCKEMLENPGEFIESKNYFSWERFFTDFLEKETRQTMYEYHKGKLNRAYCTPMALNKFKAGGF